MIRLRFLLLCTLFLLSLSPALWAIGSNMSIGPAAANANSVLLNVAALVEAVFYIAATVMFTSCIMKFRIHFQNPQQVPMSTPITELILAIVLGCLPYITQLATKNLEGAPPSVLAPYIQQTESQSGKR